jgi:Zn-dependent protease with chaperone function
MNRWRWFLRGLGVAAWFVWYSVVARTANPSTAPQARASWLLFPPGLAMTLCDAWEITVFLRLQRLGWNWRSWLLRLAYRNVLPWLFLLATIWDASTDRADLTPLSYAATYLSYILLARLSRMLDLLFLTGQRLASGEVHDQILALAERENVALGQVTVAATGAERLVNAAALLGNDILLTDQLLQHLTTREVLGLVAHELAHLRMRPLIVRCLALVATCVLVACALQWSNILVPCTFGLPEQTALAMLAVYFLLRRFEYAADARAVSWTGDPEALAAAIVKVTELNLVPLQWSWIEELVHSRPSAARRVRAIRKLSD